MLALRLRFTAGLLLGLSNSTSGQDIHQPSGTYTASNHEKDWLSRETREHWMRYALGALDTLLATPCPFAAFGTVIVNHTRHDELGDLVCIGANNIMTGNPTLHAQALGAFSDLSLYTTAEPCPMCAAALRWAGLRECVFGTSIPTLIGHGWPQIPLRTREIFERSDTITDAYFAWQFNSDHACPKGCKRPPNSTDMCVVNVNGSDQVRIEL
ncbi:hypothetical protein CLAFUW4_00980 [Fulvia fulva]|uniref:CMP/dCMP-type deaminase domain-containing protein n=1 Tax=Passalora fulva TaxID=5499 RepID=A0A9Q8L530_PASFU|nr:uncharacterized protein CLAFUR5_00986 [Fulvia fulva]KAK4635010.1 hypothetical protein CLAFUR4_00981 [Fulvia fulva]KAK4636509.1 hypothetical protein CLAFUR0_00982 [Fulvia fulva]UJO11030.1 hypothetical protein CLAFUR5_00986 [Fulvia fulva]WPV09451.1 hypothetical protein CLAFUW4_00980 [Fulvia fulva]WPV24033.1 hypothetical protein CLAFUW7_00836 [Fulvia fulva]